MFQLNTLSIISTYHRSVAVAQKQLHCLARNGLGFDTGMVGNFHKRDISLGLGSRVEQNLNRIEGTSADQEGSGDLMREEF